MKQTKSHLICYYFMLKTKRIYESYSDSDGYRILVDRLWPRGISKDGAHIDVWMKEIAPSTELRKWFAHDTEKWDEFTKRYTEELTENKQMLLDIKKLEQEHQTITILYGAKDTEHNQAQVLLKVLKEMKG